MDLKRKAEDESAIIPFMKRSRNDVISIRSESGALQETGPPRTSNLLAPIMLLTGHEAEIFTLKFAPQGDMLASAGFDRLIYLWDTYGECENFHVMKGHTGAIMELKFSTDGERLYTCSTDKNICIWDLSTGERMKKLQGHTGFVNSIDVARRGPQLICTGSDDGTVKFWDSRKKTPVKEFQNTYQVTSVHFNDTAEQIFSGGIDNDIKVWDLRKDTLSMRIRGHTDTITGLSLSPDGSYLLSNGMDNTMRIWDVRPYAQQDRCLKIFQGHQHSFEKNLLRCDWSIDGARVASGSGDRFVYIWDTTSRQIMYKLPGHAGSVNQVVFHPVEPIVASCSSDKKIYLGEIES